MTNMEQMLSESLAEALSNRITEKVLAEMHRQWAPILAEMSDTRDSNTLLYIKVKELETAINSQSTNLTESVELIDQKLQSDKEYRQKSLKLLNEVMKDLGFE